MAPTHDYVIDNQSAPNFRADLNNALQAIVSNNSGSTEPPVTYANMMWYDTANNLLRMRNEADDAFITLGTLDQVANTFAASVALASEAEAEAGTENTKLMTPLRTAQAITALTPDSTVIMADLGAFTAGNTRRYFNPTVYTTSVAHVFVQAFRANLGGSGVLRVRYEDRNDNTFGTPHSRVVVDGTTVATFNPALNSYTVRNVDVTLNVGSFLQIQHKASTSSGNADIRNVEFLTDGEQIMFVTNQNGVVFT